MNSLMSLSPCSWARRTVQCKVSVGNNLEDPPARPDSPPQTPLRRDAFYHIPFLCCQAKIYAIGLMYTLNSRTVIRRDVNAMTTASRLETKVRFHGATKKKTPLMAVRSQNHWQKELVPMETLPVFEPEPDKVHIQVDTYVYVSFCDLSPVACRQRTWRTDICSRSTSRRTTHLFFPSPRKPPLVHLIFKISSPPTPTRKRRTWTKTLMIAPRWLPSLLMR
jgi:hypothetical protein